jgi:dCMP deaminase
MDWNEYFINIANEVSKKSHCLSSQKGCVVVKDKNIMSTGYNGPPSRYTHCDDYEARFDLFKLFIYRGGILTSHIEEAAKDTAMCPRRYMGFKSGEGLDWCSASHAETNAIVQAARNGHSINGATLYCNFREIPCRECSKLIVSSGITKVVLNGSPIDYAQIGISGRKILGTCRIEVVNKEESV